MSAIFGAAAACGRQTFHPVSRHRSLQRSKQTVGELSFHKDVFQNCQKHATTPAKTARHPEAEQMRHLPPIGFRIPSAPHGQGSSSLWAQTYAGHFRHGNGSTDPAGKPRILWSLDAAVTTQQCVRGPWALFGKAIHHDKPPTTVSSPLPF